jgi:hypothetical protein
VESARVHAAGFKAGGGGGGNGDYDDDDDDDDDDAITLNFVTAVVPGTQAAEMGNIALGSVVLTVGGLQVPTHPPTHSTAIIWL